MSREYEIKQCKKCSASKNYTDETFNRIYDIFVTYRSRGGILNFSEFAWIPIKKDPGNNLDQETTMWTKYIREYISAHGI